MSVFDMFKKKAKQQELLTAATSSNFDEDKAAQGNTAATTPTKTTQELFEEWYAKLTPDMKKKVDIKMEKLRLRAGTPVCCKKCGKPGSNKETGPLRKVQDDYIHQNCTGGING